MTQYRAVGWFPAHTIPRHGIIGPTADTPEDARQAALDAGMAVERVEPLPDEESAPDGGV